MFDFIASNKNLFSADDFKMFLQAGEITQDQYNQLTGNNSNNQQASNQFNPTK